MWMKNLVIIAGLFPGIVVMVGLVLNFVAVAYDSIAAVPPGTMFAVLVIFSFVALPLTIFGTLVGKNYDGVPNNPCRVNPVPRHIPDRPWYAQRWVNILCGGILPFGSIFIEMYFVFTSFWHYKYYYVYGFMLLVYIILVVVLICTTIVSTYFLLNAEDYRWQWTSFCSAASTAVYVFVYSVYYYFVKTHMTGFFQAAFYFGYMFLFCVGLGIMCGAVGFLGTSLFVRKIYAEIKLD